VLLPHLPAQPGMMFARALGHSMWGPPLFICSGDVLMFDFEAEPRNGDIVLALLDGDQLTIKRFYRKGGTVELRPLNLDYQPVVLKGAKARAAKIQGVAVSIYRGIRHDE
jgi:repressor LexA